MADSRTEQIIQAIVETLGETGGPTGLAVNRSRLQAVNAAELPMISVYPVREDVKRATENRRTQVLDRTLTVQLRCRVQGTDEALDPIRQWAVARMAADLSLGGVALEVLETAADWSASDGSDADFSVCEMDFNVRYVTARADLSLAA